MTTPDTMLTIAIGASIDRLLRSKRYALSETGTTTTTRPEMKTAQNEIGPSPSSACAERKAKTVIPARSFP